MDRSHHIKACENRNCTKSFDPYERLGQSNNQSEEAAAKVRFCSDSCRRSVRNRRNYLRRQQERQAKAREYKRRQKQRLGIQKGEA